MKQLDEQNNATTYWKSNQYVDIYNNDSEPTLTATLCKTCLIIDALCNEYYSITDEDRKSEIIEELLRYEINGYKILQFMESNGKILLALDEIDNVSHFVFGRDYNDDEKNNLLKIDPNINFSVALSKAHWCSFCGARKPDIIDDNM